MTYSLNGGVTTRLDRAAASRRRGWDICPQSATIFEGRPCPVNALTVIAVRDSNTAPVAVENQGPEDVVGCTRYLGSPEVTFKRVAWLRPPPELRDCFSAMAIAVSVDTQGSIVGVDLALSGP